MGKNPESDEKVLAGTALSRMLEVAVMKTVFFLVWFAIWIVGFCWGGEQFKDPGGLFGSIVCLTWFFGWIMAGIWIGDWLEEKKGKFF
jgi:hypothetical protein